MNRLGSTPVIPPINRSLVFLSHLNPVAFNIFRDEIYSRRHFLIDGARINRLVDLISEADERAFSNENASDADYTANYEITQAIRTVRFFYSHLNGRFDSTVDKRLAIIQFLQEVMRKSDIADIALDRIVALIEDNKFADAYSKREWLEQGIVDNAIRFSSFAHLRPSFDDDRTAISGGVVSSIFRVMVRSETGEQKSHYFQLDENSLSDFKNAVLDLEKKIAVIRNDSRLHDLITKYDDDYDE